MSALDTGIGMALGGLRRLAGLEVVDRLGQRERLERLVHDAARRGFGAATTAARAFSGLGRDRATRQQPTERPDQFDLTPTEEQEMLRDAFQGFADTELRDAARAADDDSRAPAELLGRAAPLGATVLGIPTELGGVVDERSSVTALLATEALAHGDPGLAATILAPGAVATALALWGTAEQQDRYLTAFTGDDPPVAALAVQEPRAAFDPLAPATRATRDGGDFVLDGTKSSVLRVADAELFLVAAALEGTPALFLVEGGAEGLRQEAEPTMGIRAAAAGTLQLTRVRVPDAARVGADVPDVVAELVARSRIAWAALALGAGQAVLDLVIPYVNEREAFGEPISHRQAVAFMVSDIALELEGLRLVSLRAASLLDQGRDARRQAALARRLTTTIGMQIGSDGVQLLGGHGYVKEHPVERWYRDLRVAGVLEGGLLV